MTQNEKDKKLKSLIDKIQEFCLMDDAYMNVFFDNQPELIQLVLRIILNKPDLIVKMSVVQKPFKNLKGRSAALDIVAVDSTGKMYDIEIQNDPDEADPKRAAFHSALITSESLAPKQEFSELPETYVIFILRNDYYRAGLPYYEAVRTITQLDNKTFGDGSHIIYVNGAYTKNDEFGHLIHDFKCKKPDDMYHNELKKRAKIIKDTKGGNSTMCKIMQDLRDEGRAEGRAEGKAESSMNFALNLLKMGKLSIEEIAQSADLTSEKVRELAKTIDK